VTFDDTIAKHIPALQSMVGVDHVLADPDLRSGYEVDWTGRFSGQAALVVRPADVDQVALVLAWCNDHGIAVIPQAGNTGLVGGGVPRAVSVRPTIVMSLRRLDTIPDIDHNALQLTAGAGVTIAGWRRAARAVGLDTPVDFAARDTATIGGAIATNAGGSRVLRYGTMRQQVVGIEAVLADGSGVGSLAGLPKETAGLHWPSILCGSEGTLAVVTAARLRLVPHFEHVVTAMVAVASIDDAVTLAGALRHRLDTLDALEIIQPAALALVAAHLDEPSPVPIDGAASFVVIECAGHEDPTADLADVLADSTGVLATAVATDPQRRVDILAFRDRITEAISTEAARTGTTAFKLDVAVPLGAIGELLDVAERAAVDDGARLIPFGHLAEGNLHLNHLGVRDPDALADVVLTAVAGLGGTISAEHGIGIAKARWLHLVRSPADLAAQRAIKRALDPNGILNPGVLDATGPGSDETQVP
jgi:FAD/FMN-containing dehydrogenase